MNPLTTYALLPHCDMWFHDHIKRQSPRLKRGVVLCYSRPPVIHEALQELNRDGAYIFVCRDNDSPFSEVEHERFPQVKHWFAVNCDVQDECVEAMPFGISSGSTEEKTAYHVQLLKATPKSNKVRKAFGCFTINEDRPEIAVFRKPARDALKHSPAGAWSEPLGIIDYLERMAKHQFVFSPKGGGMDCHRTWEALYLDCFPVVMRHPIYDHFSDMPIVMTDDWGHLSEQWLDAQTKEMLTRSRVRLDAGHWIERIKWAREMFL